MKKLVAYIHTNRVHWLVEQLGSLGIQEIIVTEYFRPTSQISRFDVIVGDDIAESVRRLVQRVGSNGSPGDHFVELFDHLDATPDPRHPGDHIAPGRKPISDIM